MELYKFSEITPTMTKESFIIAFSVRLVHRSFIITVYKTFNIPVVHPSLESTLQYVIELAYFARIKDKTFYTTPMEIDIIPFTENKRIFCSGNNVLYRLDKSNFCIAAFTLTPCIK